jgi:hypothetical protein
MFKSSWLRKILTTIRCFLRALRPFVLKGNYPGQNWWLKPPVRSSTHQRAGATDNTFPLKRGTGVLFIGLNVIVAK